VLIITQVIKDSWPPKEAKNVETIAASFVPPKTGSAVRLFNLAVDVKSAGLTDSTTGKSLTDGILYTLGSKWTPVPSTPQTFAAFADGAELAAAGGNASFVTPLASAPFSPPNGEPSHHLPPHCTTKRYGMVYAVQLTLSSDAAPQVFTAFLMGSKAFGCELLCAQSVLVLAHLLHSLSVAVMR
jgi:hypothetical protein